MNKENIKTEYPDEEIYRQEIMLDIPDLWDRIDKGIDALEVKSDISESEKAMPQTTKGKVFDFKKFAVYAAPVAALLIIAGLALPVLNNVSQRTKNYTAAESAATADAAACDDNYTTTTEECAETNYEAEATAEEFEESETDDYQLDMAKQEMTADNENGRDLSEVKGNGSSAAAANASSGATANASSAASSFAHSATPQNVGIADEESSTAEMEGASDSYAGKMILVSFDEEVTGEQKIAIMQKYGLEMVYDYKYMNMCSFTCPDCDDLNKLCEDIAKESNVISVEID
jgi:hypothetical protein